MKIIISVPAKEDIKSIFDYYSRKASNKVAHSIRKKILDEIKSLSNFYEFQDEEYLERANMGHKRCIVGNYKIIYRVVDANTINITDVFDTRKNPTRIQA